MSEFDRLMSEPRRCRVCGKACQGSRCRDCYSVRGRLVNYLREAKQGLSEERVAQLLETESMLRRMEAQGLIHQTGDKWAQGPHPDSEALREAWAAAQIKPAASIGAAAIDAGQEK